MRYLAGIAAIALFCGFSVLSAQRNSVNFAGNWKISSATSISGALSDKDLQINPGTLKIDQSTNKLVIEGFQIDPHDGSSLVKTMAYRLDGGKSLNDNGNSDVNVSNARWTDNGNKLTIKTRTTRIDQGNEFSYKEVQVLSLEHGNLVINVSYNTPYSENNYEVVYERNS